MITIYKVRFDIEHYQHFFPTDLQFHLNPLAQLDGRQVADEWVPPEVYSVYPKKKAGAFWGFCSTAAFAVTPEATEMLQDHFLRAGELLPLPYKGKTFNVLNITRCIDCLDQANSKYILPDDPEIGVKKYAFHIERLSEGLIKIPETCFSEILLVEGMSAVEDGFKYAVEQNGFKGLDFFPIWTDEGKESPLFPRRKS